MGIGRLGRSAACLGKQGSCEGEQGGDGLSLFLVATFVSGLTLRRPGESPPTHTSQIIFVSERKHLQILRHNNCLGLYSLWKKDN